MNKITLIGAALMAAFVIIGCGGNGAPSTVNNGGNIVTSDAPAASGDFMSLKPGPVTLRHAEGEHAVDRSNAAKVLHVHMDPDGARLGLLETLNGFTFNHGFSGTPVLTAGGIVGAIRQGSDNSSGMPDNEHAEMVDLQQMLDEFRNANAARSTSATAVNKPYPMVYSAPQEVLTYTNWRTGRQQQFIGVDASARQMANRTAPSGRGGPGSYQGKGVAFMYSPYIYATGTITYQPDANHLLTLGHGMFEFPQDCNLPASQTFAYRMNDGTMAGIPVAKGMIGAAIRSLNYSTVVDLSAVPATSTSQGRMLSTSGAELKKVEHFVAKDNDAYLVSYSNMVNLVMTVPHLIEAGYGNAGATGRAQAILTVPTKDGSVFVYTKGYPIGMVAGGGGGGGGDEEPFDGMLTKLIREWVSNMTFDAFITSNQPVWGLATLEIKKV